jgi:hypothetical protein
VRGAGGQSASDVVLLGGRGQHHDVRARRARPLAQATADVQTVHVRQIDVEEDQLGIEVGGERERGGAVRGLHDANAIVLERDAYQFHHVRLVIGDQNGQHAPDWEQGARHACEFSRTPT